MNSKCPTEGCLGLIPLNSQTGLCFSCWEHFKSVANISNDKIALKVVHSLADLQQFIIDNSFGVGLKRSIEKAKILANGLPDNFMELAVSVINEALDKLSEDYGDVIYFEGFNTNLCLLCIRERGKAGSKGNEFCKFHKNKK